MRVKMSKEPPPAPTASAVGPCHTVIQIVGRPGTGSLPRTIAPPDHPHRTRSFPGADIGSDHDLVMMTFQVRLKKARKPNQPRLRFDIEKLRDPDVACTFHARIGGKFAPLV